MANHALQRLNGAWSSLKKMTRTEQTANVGDVA